MPDWRMLPWRAVHLDGPRLLSRIRRCIVLATHRHARVTIPRSVYLGPGFRLWVPQNGEFTLGEGVVLRRGFTCEIGGQGRVTIGARTVLTSDALIQCTTSVDIGADCVFGQALQIVDGSHRFRNPDVPMLEQGYDFSPVRIGDGVAIMTKCTVIGVTIGDRAFIGANSVVTRDVPPFSLAIGAPARVVEQFGPGSDRPAGSAADG